MMNLMFKEEVYRIIGAAVDVHKALGTGFLEAVYQEALAFEFNRRGIPFVARSALRIRYKDTLLKKHYVADFVCFDSIILELKSADVLVKANEAQIINYLKATGMRVGILINFGGHPRLQWKRFIV